MLGPNDLDDWGFDANDMLKSELRLNPLVREIAQPNSVAAKKTPKHLRDLCGKLINGDCLEDQDLDELRAKFQPN